MNDPRIEQAIYTSAQTARGDGYQVVAASEGVDKADARELAVWCPSHDALLKSTPDAVSVNFHPLPSGAWCVSRTTPAGGEFSGRGGPRVYTHCFLVPGETLARFANNPFAFLRAALGSGLLVVHEETPAQLHPVRLAGRTSVVDQSVLERLAKDPGPRAMGALVQAALSSDRLAVGGGTSVEQAVAGLINCLPPECRTEFSFCTGLKPSLRRLFRLVALGDDRAELRHVERDGRLAVLRLSDDPPKEFAARDGWARFVEHLLQSGHIPFLTARFSERQPDLTSDDLPALGLQLIEEIETSSLDDHHFGSYEPWLQHSGAKPGAGGPDQQPTGASDAPDAGPLPASEAAPAAPASAASGSNVQHAHAAHDHFEKTVPAGDTAALALSPPSKTLDVGSPEVLEKLETLDDLVYDAIAGKTFALNRLKELWPEIHESLGDDLLQESREQYLRYALSIWENRGEVTGIRNPARAVQALDVLCLLFDSDA